MESSVKKKIELKTKRAQRVRKNLKGTAERPRLCVNVSNKHVYAQLIDDVKGVTIASASSIQEKGKKSKLVAASIGEILGTKAKENNVLKAVFDRGSKKYHGLVAEIAAKAREVGLQV